MERPVVKSDSSTARLVAIAVVAVLTMGVAGVISACSRTAAILTLGFVGVIVLTILLSRPLVFLQLIGPAIVLGNFLALPVGWGGRALLVSLSDIILATSLPRLLIHLRGRFRFRRLFLSSFLLTASLVTSWFVNIGPVTTLHGSLPWSSIFEFVQWLLTTGMLLIGLNLNIGERVGIQLSNRVHAYLVLSIGLSLLFSVPVRGIVFDTGTQLLSNVGRFKGLVGDPNQAGQMAAVCALLSMTRSSPFGRVVGLAVSLAGVVASQSREALTFLIVSTLIWSVLSNRRSLKLPIAVASAVSILVPFVWVVLRSTPRFNEWLSLIRMADLDRITNGRLSIWKSALGLVSRDAKTLLFGLGYSNAFVYSTATAGVPFGYGHNMFIQALLNGGLPALCLFCWWLYEVFRIIGAQIDRGSKQPSQTGLMAVHLGLIISGFVSDHYWTFPFLNRLFVLWLVLNLRRTSVTVRVEPPRV